MQITRETNYGTWRFQKGWNPLHIVDAEGCYITDANGKRYLDFSSQLMCMNLGHKNQAVIDAIKQAGAGSRLCDAGLRDDRTRRALEAAARSSSEGTEQVLLHDERNRRERSGVQDRSHVHGQNKDHRALPLVSRLDVRARLRPPAIRGGGRWSRAGRRRG